MKLLFFFLLIIIACSSEPKTYNLTDNDTVKTIIYDRNQNIEWKSERILVKDTSYSRNNLIYQFTPIEKGKLPVVEDLSFFKSKDSIHFCGVTCYLRDYKDYSIENKKYRIYRYLLDDLSAADEESDIYLNDTLGLVRKYSLVWGKTTTYFKDSVTYKLNKAMFIDTSTFVSNENNHEQYYRELNDFNAKRMIKNNKR